MAVRAGMGDLIDLVERLINDETNKHHSTQEIQDALDQHRMEARYVDCAPVKTIAEGGTVTYLIFTAPNGFTHWDEDTAFYDSGYTELTPSASDWFGGRWTFGSEPDRPVKILGFTYDVYAASADLLDVQASMRAEDLQSFSGQGGSFTYAAKAGSLRNQAKAYRAKMRAQSVTLIRSDVNILNA